MTYCRLKNPESELTEDMRSLAATLNGLFKKGGYTYVHFIYIFVHWDMRNYTIVVSVNGWTYVNKILKIGT
jgi:hypothetical protein